MRSRSKYRASARGRHLNDRERRHFSFGSMTKERFLAKLTPIIRAAAREGIRKPPEVSRFLNREKIATATGEPWTPRLAWCLLSLIFEDKNDPAASLWNQKNSVPALNGKTRRHNPADLLVLKLPDGTGVRRKRQQPKKQRLRLTHNVARTRQGKTTHGPSFVERTIRNLRSMPTDRTVRIRHNALTQLVSSDDPAFQKEIRRLLDAITSEWRRRQLEAEARPDGYFKWPTTDAPGGDGSLFAGNWPSEGLLHMMQYSVSREHDLCPALRREILTHIFKSQLPPLISRGYMSGWGTPNSPARLEKMADSIAAFVRNAKRQRTPKMDNAIGEWEADLRFLYDRYYVGRFQFGWPITHL